MISANTHEVMNERGQVHLSTAKAVEIRKGLKVKTILKSINGIQVDKHGNPIDLPAMPKQAIVQTAEHQAVATVETKPESATIASQKRGASTIATSKD